MCVESEEDFISATYFTYNFIYLFIYGLDREWKTIFLNFGSFEFQTYLITLQRVERPRRLEMPATRVNEPADVCW